MIPEELLKCLQCGECSAVCPVTYVKKEHSLRRLVHKLRLGVEPSQEELWSCAFCYACSEVCERGVKPVEQLMKVRSSYGKRKLPKGLELMVRAVKEGKCLFPRTRRVERLKEELGLTKLYESNSKLAIFPGCFIDAKLPQLEKACVELLLFLGLRAKRLRFVCCPNVQLRAADEELGEELSRENLAALRGCDEVIALCPGCYSTLKEKALETQFDVRVSHIAHVILRSKRELEGGLQFKLELRVAPHEGCHALRPGGLANLSPRDFEGMLQMLGCEVVDYELRELCCGMPLSTSNGEIASRVRELKLESMRKAGADCVATLCPVCFLQFELVGEGSLPVFYYPQLLAVALGEHPRELGVNLNLTRGEELLRKLLVGDVQA